MNARPLRLNQFTPCAVGRSNNLFERAIQRFVQSRAGEYVVYRRDLLPRLRQFCHKVRQTLDPTGRRGPIYLSMSPHALGNIFLGLLVQQELCCQLEAFRIIYAAVPMVRDAAEGEKMLAHDIGLKKLHCTFISAGPKQNFVHCDPHGSPAAPS